MSQNIPFVDLRAQHEEVRREIEAAIKDIIDRSSFIGGKYVTNFEREFAEYLGAVDVVGVANGTDALWLALVALGIGKQDAIITVPNTFIATVEAITRSGALPIFVDVDLETANMSISALKRCLEEDCVREDNGELIHRASNRIVAAIMPVHLYGQPVDIDSLMQVAAEYGLPVVEDACQAHGARYLHQGSWKRAGTVGVAAGFSFYPGKNLGAMGDGGAVAVNDPELAQKIRILRDHGSSEKYIHVTPQGWNSRLDAIQAAVLSAKLKRLDDWNSQRRAMAQKYREVLTEIPLLLPHEPAYAESVYHLFVVLVQDRDQMRQELGSRGVGVGLHYPIPLHRQAAYAHLGVQEGSYPNAERSARELLSLPMHPALTGEQVERVGAIFREVLLSQTVGA